MCEQAEWGFGGLGVLKNPEELLNAFTTILLDVDGGCLGTHRQAKKKFVSKGTLDTNDQCRWAGLLAELSCSGS